MPSTIPDFILDEPARSLSPGAWSTGSGSGSGSGESDLGGNVVSPTLFAPGAKARVIWVGNVKENVHHDELREIFGLALGEGLKAQGVRVTHVTVQYQRKKSFNSATVFMNRSVPLAGLAERLRFVAKQPLLTIRKCRSKRRTQKLRKKAREEAQRQAEAQSPPAWTHAWVPPASMASSPYSVANADAQAFVEQHSTPLPAEVTCSRFFFDFVRELDEGRELEPMDGVFQACRSMASQ